MAHLAPLLPAHSAVATSTAAVCVCLYVLTLTVILRHTLLPCFTLQKQKQPAAAPNVGAILGEAADLVVGKYASSSGAGGAGSPYLNRLSEIQIQDEAHIYQQLVKPEEGAL